MNRKLIEISRLLSYAVACILFEIGAIGYVIDLNNKYSVWMYFLCASFFLIGITIEIIKFLCCDLSIEEIP